VGDFVHHLRPRYAEVDAQGVVFNAHWLTYFDEASTRYFEHLGFAPKEAFFRDFDMMVVKAVVEWEGPAGFDDVVAIAVECGRLGTKSFDLVFTAVCEGIPACVGTITYVSVRPGSHDSVEIPGVLRTALQD
jgi:acyl-CoA thioester hydrolase